MDLTAAMMGQALQSVNAGDNFLVSANTQQP
jgi:hypothetical protein